MSDQKVNARPKSNTRYTVILLSCLILGGVLGAVLGEKATIVKPHQRSDYSRYFQ